MNGKQIACVMLMMIIGIVTYSGQMVHKKTDAVRTAAKSAQEASEAADSERQIAEIRSNAATTFHSNVNGRNAKSDDGGS